MTAEIENLLATARRARREDHPEEALGAYRAAADLARTQGVAPLLAHALRHQSDLDREAGRLPQALAAAREALSACRGHATRPLDLANTIRPLALALDDAGDRADAAPLWREALDLYRRLGIEAGVRECEDALAGR